MFKLRLLTAVVLVAVVLAILFLAPSSWALAFFALVAGLGAWEWGGFAGGNPFFWRKLFPLLVMLGCGLLYLLPEIRLSLWGVAALFWLVAVPCWFRRRWPLVGNVPFLAIGLLLLLPTWGALARLYALGPTRLLAVMGLVWVADIAAYLAGRAFGRHKLAPAISPGKTWEGAAGAALAVQAYGFGMAAAFKLEVAPLIYAVLLLLLTAASIVGDLFESLIKRQVGVKDSSALLPGHGGVLDRIDSLTSTLPLTALVLTLVNP
ncbi:hypothetical protein B9N43_04110 [Denitratisoma sp. DHT3]|uniref:phosphatidate cytidylyltransferase n=1 Tax=Denitratisoma sp. DHT3 TaxID=1981880 RepID=UPI001198565D|nr:phosphatidate cytidylyltransferase [Denitratisoma sp. DHT3]QDX80506.1 hypothetical protein B9N43_04110 [Denitratisoma sp. DHT3]